jgi:hypothetical protein
MLSAFRFSASMAASYTSTNTKSWSVDKPWVERAQVRKAVSILGHLLLALRAFLRLEVYRLQTGVSWYEAKAAILREAIRRYLAHPRYVLQPTA